MKGVYKTKEGSKVEVLNFDEANKIAYATIEQETRWYPESDYSTWIPEEEEIEEDAEGDDEVSEEVSDKPKKKTVKKKTK